MENCLYDVDQWEVVNNTSFAVRDQHISFGESQRVYFAYSTVRNESTAVELKLALILSTPLPSHYQSCCFQYV